MSTSSELSHLFRALKAPAAARALPKLADRARAEDWSYERFAEALLSTEHASREAHGGEGRIKAARFPARKTLEEFDFTFQRSVKKTLIQHLGQLDFLHGKENVVLLGPPGTGKTHLSIALGIRACLAGHRVTFRTATEWVALLADAQRAGRLDTELDRLQRIALVIVDEVGYIPFDPQAANLIFMLVSRRYESTSRQRTAISSPRRRPVKAAVRKIAPSCSDTAARTSAQISSGAKTSIAVQERCRGFSTSAIGLRGRLYARSARTNTPFITVSSFTLVRLLSRSVAFQASIRSLVTSSSGRSPNAGTRWALIVER